MEGTDESTELWQHPLIFLKLRVNNILIKMAKTRIRTTDLWCHMLRLWQLCHILTGNIKKLNSQRKQINWMCMSIYLSWKRVNWEENGSLTNIYHYYGSNPMYYLQGGNLFKKRPSSASSRLFSSFQINITILTTNICEKMSIQSTVLGFKLTTFGTRVSSHNH